MQGLALTTRSIRNGGFKAAICLYFAVVLSVVEPYLVRQQLHSFAIVGSVVEFDCISNSSGPVDWWYVPFGTSEKYWIARGNKTKSETFRIKTEATGQAALIIEWVNLSTAGMYECHDFNGVSVQGELTVLDSNPQCNELQKSSSRYILCSFRCAGNRCLGLEITETDSWNMSCNSLSSSVECEFGGSCNWTMPYTQPSTVSIICGVNGNSICEWDVNNASIYIKGTNESIGGWRCMVETTSTIETPNIPDLATVSLCLSISALAVLVVVLVLVFLVIFLLTAMYIRQQRKLESLIKSRTTIPRSDYIDLEVNSPQNKRQLSSVYANDQGLISNASSTAMYQEALLEIEEDRSELSAQTQSGSQPIGLDPFYEALKDKHSPSTTQTYASLSF